jgi:hypothetical protein
MKYPQSILSGSLVVLSLALLAPSVAGQTNAAGGAQSEAARCEKILPLKILNADAGGGFKAEFAYDRDPGEIECGWVRLEAGGDKTQVVVKHRNKTAIASQAKNYQAGRTVEEMWEADVRETERSQESKRELIAGAGRRAALIPLSKMRLGIRAFILRDNDSITITASGVSNENFIKVAKAIVAP